MKKYPADLLNQIEKNLLEEKEKLTQRVNSLALEDPFIDPDRVNDNAAVDTEAKEEIDHERIEALKNGINDNLSLIEEALKRIKKGNYGFCEQCKDMINTDRIAANPTAKFCIHCEKNNHKK